MNNPSDPKFIPYQKPQPYAMRPDMVIADAKHLTGDLGGKASTTQMGDAVVEAVRKAGAKFRS